MPRRLKRWQWLLVRLFCRWVPEVNIETAGSWRLVSLWGTVYARISVGASCEVRGKTVGSSSNQADAARWAETLLRVGD